MSKDTFEKFSPPPDKNGTVTGAERKKFVKSFKWDEANGTWVIDTLDSGNTPGHHEKLGGIISKNFELGREIESTTNNPQSSRSHVVLCLTVYVKDNLKSKDYEADKKRDPKSKSVPIPKNVSKFKLMVCDLAGAENKFKCSGFKNDIEKFYNIYVPKDITNRGSLKYAYPPMYDLYRCRINTSINPSNKIPDTKLRDITLRFAKLIAEYEDIGENIVGNEEEKIFEKIEGGTSLDVPDLGFDSHKTEFEKYQQFLDGGEGAPDNHPYQEKGFNKDNKDEDFMTNDTDKLKPISVGDWWANRALGANVKSDKKNISKKH